MLRLPRIFGALLLSLSLCPAPAFAFDSPLSDQAVREAYFLGQRHDGSFLANYFKPLPLPKNGPHISSVTFLTPFAQLAQFSSSYVGNYSAQQAQTDHRGQKEVVSITVEIHLTATYGSMIPNPDSSRSKSFPPFIPRPYDFWKDFHVQVYDGTRLLSPSDSTGQSLYRCGRLGPCRPKGASLDFEFPADAFSSDSATIVVIPPEGDPVSVEFNLLSLR
jgi:hypothetical protein